MVDRGRAGEASLEGVGVPRIERDCDLVTRPELEVLMGGARGWFLDEAFTAVSAALVALSLRSSVLIRSSCLNLLNSLWRVLPGRESRLS